MHKRKKITSLKNQHNIKKKLFDLSSVWCRSGFIYNVRWSWSLSHCHTPHVTHTHTWKAKQNKTNRFTLSILFTIESNGLGSDAFSHSLSLARLLRRPRSIRMNERCVYVRFCTTNLLNIWTMQILCTSSRSASFRFGFVCVFALSHSITIHQIWKKVTFVPIVISDFMRINSFDVTFISIHCARIPIVIIVSTLFTTHTLLSATHMHKHTLTLSRVPLIWLHSVNRILLLRCIDLNAVHLVHCHHWHTMHGLKVSSTKIINCPSDLSSPSDERLMFTLSEREKKPKKCALEMWYDQRLKWLCEWLNVNKNRITTNNRNQMRQMSKVGNKHVLSRQGIYWL